MMLAPAMAATVLVCPSVSSVFTVPAQHENMSVVFSNTFSWAQEAMWTSDRIIHFWEPWASHQLGPDKNNNNENNDSNKNNNNHNNNNNMNNDDDNKW